MANSFTDKKPKVVNKDLLPHSPEAEQAVLGAVLSDSECLNKVAERIADPEYFYKKAHQTIYKAFLELAEANNNIDVITTTQHLKDRDLLDEIGGRSYLSALTDHAPIAANAEYYAKTVQSKSLLRSLITAGNEIVELGYDTEEELDALVDKAEQLVFGLAQSKSKEDLTHVGDIVQTTWQVLEEREANKGALIGLDTGYYDLNAITSGLQKNDLIILAARPSMGKTALALNIAENAAIIDKKPVAVFSLEMSKEQLVQRLLCSRAQVDSNRIRTGQMYPEDWTRLGAAMSDIGQAPIFIDDSAAVTVMELRGKCRRLKAEHGDLGMIIVDYLQLMQGKASENRVNQISEISRGLKMLARELEVPVMALSQLSRAVEARQDKRPMLSDLRESGSIEQDADIVAFVYRDDYYNPDSEKAGVAEIIIAKQRSGPVGTIDLLFQSNITRFRNPVQETNT